MTEREKYGRAIIDKLGRRELLEQLAEEGAELSKAALKMIRADGLSGNVTPVSGYEAFGNLLEEARDVMMVMALLRITPDDIDVDNCKKWKRWAERLGVANDDR